MAVYCGGDSVLCGCVVMSGVPSCVVVCWELCCDVSCGMVGLGVVSRHVCCDVLSGGAVWCVVRWCGVS